MRFAGALSRKDRVWIDSFHRGYKERLRRSREEGGGRRREREREIERTWRSLRADEEREGKGEGKRKKEIGTKDKVREGIKVENVVETWGRE